MACAMLLNFTTEETIRKKDYKSKTFSKGYKVFIIHSFIKSLFENGSNIVLKGN